MSIMDKFLRYFTPWYILEVDHRGEDLKIMVKSFTKKTPTHIVGTTIDDEFFELRSNTPMDYFIKEYRDDLK